MCVLFCHCLAHVKKVCRFRVQGEGCNVYISQMRKINNAPKCAGIGSVGARVRTVPEITIVGGGGAQLEALYLLYRLGQ
jgi:hypothetical protein